MITYSDMKANFNAMGIEGEYYEYTLIPHSFYVQGYNLLGTRSDLSNPGVEYPYGTYSWGTCPSLCDASLEVIGGWNSATTFAPGTSYQYVILLTPDTLILAEKPGECAGSSYAYQGYGNRKHFGRR